MEKRKAQLIAGGTIFLVAFLVGFFTEHFFHVDDFTFSKQIRELGTTDGKHPFKYINPLLECDVAGGLIDSYKENFQGELRDLIEQIKVRQEITTIGVYFRDLNNGPTFGIHGDENFIPASLLKVPVMMAYLRLADDDGAILNKKLSFDKKVDLVPGGAQLIPPSSEIVEGTTYTTKELIEHTIKYSDNQAVTLLINNLPGEVIRELYDMNGVREDVLNGPEGRLTVKEYASFFRILFNASYLSRKNSEYALDLLAHTEFDTGLKAGVPAHITVAHKFGEGGDEIEHQIHDCGIVYYPDHPYLICVMSRGKQIDKLESVIAEVSKFVYNKIDMEYGKDAGR